MPRNRNPLAQFSDAEVLRRVARLVLERARDSAPSSLPASEAAARLYLIARRVPLWTDRRGER